MKRLKDIPNKLVKDQDATTVIPGLISLMRRKEIVARLSVLPPLPAVAHEVLSILSEDPKSIVRLEQTIRHDPILTAQLLRLANSPAFCPHTYIDTVHRAIVYLGFQEVRNLCLGLAIFSMFKSCQGSEKFDEHSFWTHSMATAILSRLLAAEAGEKEPEVFFTAGLLHDLGKLALNTCFPSQLTAIIALAKDSEWPLIKAERYFGLPHTIIGGWLARSWQLPPAYVKAITSHHLSPKHPKWSRIGGLVQLADYMCHKTGMGFMIAPKVNLEVLCFKLSIGQDIVQDLLEQMSLMEDVAQTVEGIVCTISS